MCPNDKGYGYRPSCKIRPNCGLANPAIAPARQVPWSIKLMERIQPRARQSLSGVRQGSKQVQWCQLSYFSISALMRAAIESIGNGFVITDMPGSKWPLPSTALSA